MQHGIYQPFTSPSFTASITNTLKEHAKLAVTRTAKLHEHAMTHDPDDDQSIPPSRPTYQFRYSSKTFKDDKRKENNRMNQPHIHQRSFPVKHLIAANES